MLKYPVSRSGAQASRARYRALAAMSLLALTCGLLLASPAAVAEVIDEIRFSGNEKTQESTMLQELSFKAGDDVESDSIDKGREAIMDLGLFKRVESSVTREGERNVLTFTVDEKHYWFILPRLRRSGDGDIAYGISYRMHNLRGRNETLVIGAKCTNRSGSDLEPANEVSLRYTNPRFMDTAFELRTDLSFEQSEIDDVRGDLEGEYTRDLGQFRVRLNRWLNPTGPSKGWRIGTGLNVKDYEHELITGDPGLYTDATVVSMTGRIEYVSVHDRLYSRDGKHYGYEFQAASKNVLSDASFVRHQLFYRRYIPMTERPHTTLNLQLRAGYATQTVFGDAAYSLGGSTSLRGFERDTVEGDAYVLANVEFMTPMFGKNSLRGVLFADIGNAYDTVEDVDLGDLNYSAGFGLRWVLESFVRTELRLDFAHGFGEDGVNKVYASTKATF